MKIEKYSTQTFLNREIDEDTFVLSLAAEKTPNSELDALASIDVELYKRLSARVKIEHFFHSNTKRKRNLDAIQKKPRLTERERQEYINTLANYRQRENELIALIEEYHRSYSPIYATQYAEIKADLASGQTAPAKEAEQSIYTYETVEEPKKGDIIKRIKTSCPFPMLSYPVNVRYNEVRKASGIAYILLELMQQSVMKSEKIVDVLLRFGIPSDMHYLFAKELQSLIENEIVNSAVSSDYVERPEYFEQMTMSDFSLTVKGKKMFAEGAIPTGQEKAKNINLFYRPATRKYEYVCLQSYAPLETSFLGEDFLDRVSYDVSDMEDYLKATKAKVGLKAEELIAGISYDEPKKLSVKPDDNLSIEISQSGVKFVFENTDERAFFEKYYSSKLMTAGMLAKDKYKFSGDVPTVDFMEYQANNLYIPDDARKQAARPCKIFINRGKLGFNRTDNVLRFDGNGELLDLLDDNAEFALLDLAGCKYYSPVNLRIPCPDFGDTFEMQMLVESVADHDSFEKLLHTILDYCYALEFTAEIGQIILYIATVEKDPEYLRGFAYKKLCEARGDEERIEMLLKFNTAFAKSEEWKSYFKEMSEEVFATYVKTVEIENVLSKYSALSPLQKAMEMSDMTFVSRFSEQIRSKETPELVYQALESVGFDEADILPVANVIVPLMEQTLERTRVDDTTELSAKYALLSGNLWKLCDMLGVDDLANYSIRDDYNIDDFFNAYATFEKAKKSVEKYRSYAKEQYLVLDRYAAIFSPVNEVLSIERTASEHPENITKKYIDEQISRGRYSVAISSLLIKAQYDLRILLSADSFVQANELIDNAEQEKIIRRDEANDLHKLRMCRNGLQHPEARQIPYDKATLEKWRDLVFSLKGEEK